MPSTCPPLAAACPSTFSTAFLSKAAQSNNQEGVHPYKDSSSTITWREPLLCKGVEGLPFLLAVLTPSPQSGPSPKAPAALGQLSSSLWQHPAQWDALKAWGCILFWDAAKGLTIP